MFNSDYITKEEVKEHILNWPKIPEYPYRILIDRGSGFEKTNALLNLINHQPDIDKMYLYAKDQYEVKRQLFINKEDSTSLMYLNDSKAFIEYLSNMDDIYKNIAEYKPNKKWKILIIFHDMIADMLSKKKLNTIVTELFIKGRKLNISLVFMTQSYFAVPKNIRLNSIHYFVIKILNKGELPQLHLIIWSDMDFQDFINLYKKCTSKPYSFLVIDTTLASDNSSRSRKNLLERK